MDKGEGTTSILLSDIDMIVHSRPGSRMSHISAHTVDPEILDALRDIKDRIQKIEERQSRSASRASSARSSKGRPKSKTGEYPKDNVSPQYANITGYEHAQVVAHSR